MIEAQGARPAPSDSLDAVIVGAGFAGLYMLHRLRGLGLRARVFETGDGVGGTWYWNRYPGARCDLESFEYSYSFDEELQNEWMWSERYATQPEILKYLNHVADRFDLRRDIEFNARVAAAHYDEAAARWTVTLADGRTFEARYVIMATGCLSSANLPNIPGMDSFKGGLYHTGRWPHEGVDFTGKRVGVIGTGSSAIQSIPLIAEQAEHLTVFQRTPNYSSPAWNGPPDPERLRMVRADYPAFRAVEREHLGAAMFYGTPISVLESTPEQLHAALEERWADGGLFFLGAFTDAIVSEEANAKVAEYFRAKIRAAVKDPAVAELLSPKQIWGCKRLCVDTNYYETFNLPHVKLVDLNASPIETITPDGLRTTDSEYTLDAIVCATGFDAMTGALNKIDIRGKGGLKLKDKWAAGPRTYLGLQSAGFPNLFTITGPQSPSVLSNMVYSVEQHVDWITDAIDYLRSNNFSRMEADAAAEDAWVDGVTEIASGTLYPGCNSWYVGANVPGKPRIFMPYVGGVPAYRKTCEEVVAQGYKGFALS
jgi:cyclohexanone monooxygenase